MSNQNQSNKNPWHLNNNGQHRKKNVKVVTNKNTELKFKEAQDKLQAAVHKHVKELDSSSEEEDLEADNVIGKCLNANLIKLN